MDNNDLEKLKLLANNTEDYLKALLIKLRNNAIDNKHDMSNFHRELGTNYSAYCKKCIFEIDVDYIYIVGKFGKIASSEKVYVDLTTVDQKCLK